MFPYVSYNFWDKISLDIYKKVISGQLKTEFSERNSVFSLGLLIVCILYLSLAAYQLGLPGLHYDEAREAGINALELRTGAPVTAFRGASITLAGQQWPLMVQDYIGALNVYLAWPFLAATGIGVPNLRILSILTGLATLLTLERTITAWLTYHSRPPLHYPLSTIHCPLSTIHYPLIPVLLLAISPSFIFWSRQGIFVTNLTQPLCLICVWQGIQWLHSGKRWALLRSAMAAGFALYAKLLAIWIIAPFALLLASWWLYQRLQNSKTIPPLSLKFTILALLAGLIPLLPLLIFNWQTGGTISALFGNLGQSYYGVDNRAIFTNMPIRWEQLLQTVRGDHFWYLGGLYGNLLVPWLAGTFLVWGLWRRWRLLVAPLALITAALTLSLFTISDLFVTHYALIQPFLIGTVCLGLEKPSFQEKNRFLKIRSIFIGFLLLLWIGLDLNATFRYHNALTESGGLADHSDATYHLAYHLQYNGLGSPIALDWGLDAPIRYLSQGTVTPIEIFGYTSTVEPDAAFEERLQLFLDNPDNVYLLHAPNATVFAGRRERFLSLAQTMGLEPTLQQIFSQRDGTPLFELWRVYPIF